MKSKTERKMKQTKSMACRLKHAILTVILLSFTVSPLTAQVDKTEELKWFTDAKFGLFVHWGLYSQAAGVWRGIPARGGEHFMLYERVALNDYAKIAGDFNPVNFDAGQWVKTLKYAGMKYIVYTTKHHEGFAMYDSQVSDYNIVKRSPFKRDPLKELAEACKKEGIKLGLYYSLGRDWEDPDVPTKNAWRSNIWDFRREDEKVLQRYLERKAMPQLRELLTNYGEIAMLWFDTPELITPEQSQTVKDLIHSIQPKCLINSRICEIKEDMGDYYIMEQRLMDQIKPEPWELCITMGNNWGYNVYDVHYKTPETLVRHLADVVSKGGNMLLNIGPTDKGEFSVFTYPGLETFHTWLAENGEAIYGVHPWRVFGEDYKNIAPKEQVNTEFNDAIYDGTPQENAPDFRFTAKDNTLYIIVRNVKALNYVITSLTPADKVKKVTLLGGGKVKWKQTAQGLEIAVTDISPAKIPVYVLKIQ
jgi:alpha-L-fucosidase